MFTWSFSLWTDRNRQRGKWDRAVVGERLRVAMGMSLRKVTEHAPISKGVEASRIIVELLLHWWCVPFLMLVEAAFCQEVIIESYDYILAPPRSLSQLITSFIGSQCQGIRPVPFYAWPFARYHVASWQRRFYFWFLQINLIKIYIFRWFTAWCVF